MGKVKWVIVVIAIVTGLFLTGFLSNEPETPVMKDAWWGRGKPQPDKDVTITKFQVAVPDTVIADVKGRLSKARLGEDLEGTKFEYGFQVKAMSEVIKHWTVKFDWRKQEAILNNFPQYKTKIEGIDVHFLHVKSPNGKGSKRPLLMVHGWPGSVWEFYKVAPLLTDPAKHGGQADEAFNLICPSIPGYGFSEAPHQQGFDQADAARVFSKLMKRLGYEQYYMQGGDWGALVVTILSQAYPERVLGLHLSMFTAPLADPLLLVRQLVGVVWPTLVLPEKDIHKWYPLSDKFSMVLRESGYFHLQATRPDTAAFGLNDSPMGLAAYILEKFAMWTDPQFVNRTDGGLTERFTLDELLTNVMIYWVSGNIGPSMRFYYEFVRSDDVQGWEKLPVTVPTGLAAFPNELICPPEAFAAYKYSQIVQYTDMPRGGHFAALEEPALLANDIQSFVRKVLQLPKNPEM